MENNVILVVNIFPVSLPHLLVLPLCVCSIFSSSFLSPGHISLRGQNPELISCCGRETLRALWPRHAAINPHFFGGRGEFLPPRPHRFCSTSSLRTSWVTNSTATHTRHKHNLCSHTWVGRRTHARAAAGGSGSILDFLHVTEQQHAAKTSWSLTKIRSVETNFITWAPTVETLIMCCWQKWCEHYILPLLIGSCRAEISLTHQTCT